MIIAIDLSPCNCNFVIRAPGKILNKDIIKVYNYVCHFIFDSPIVKRLYVIWQSYGRFKISLQNSRKIKKNHYILQWKKCYSCTAAGHEVFSSRCRVGVTVFALYTGEMSFLDLLLIFVVRWSDNGLPFPSTKAWKTRKSCVGRGNVMCTNNTWSNDQNNVWNVTQGQCHKPHPTCKISVIRTRFQLKYGRSRNYKGKIIKCIMCSSNCIKIYELPITLHVPNISGCTNIFDCMSLSFIFIKPNL